MIEEITLLERLQLFAGEGAGTGSGTGGEGQSAGAETVGEGDADDGRQALMGLGVPESVLNRSRSKGRLPSRMANAFREGAGIQEPKEEAAIPKSDAGQTVEQNADDGRQGTALNWDEITKNPDFNNKIQQIIRARLKEEEAAGAKLAALAPVLKQMAEAKGVQVNTDDMRSFDVEGFAKAMSRDDSFFESKAAEMGVSPEVAKELLTLQEFRDETMQQQEEAAQRQEFQAHFAKLQQEAEAMKEIIPDFDLDRELQNDDFVRLTSPMCGVPVKQAYFALHHDEMQAAGMQAAARGAQEKLANAIRANMSRPQENGGGGMAAEPTFRPSKMTAAERENLKRQIYQAAARGEKIYPT